MQLVKPLGNLSFPDIGIIILIMNLFSIIPGYLSLAEAEEKYGIKADTLKRRCQKKEIVGAKKVGKTWFVPAIPGVNPDKTIPENYPSLNFQAAFTSNMRIYEAEAESKVALYYAHKHQIYIWEYGFYFLSLVFQNSKVGRSYMPLMALVTEAHSAIRSSFLLNLCGYHSDAIAILRKAHECTIKAIAGKKESKKLWRIAFSTSREKSENKIGVDFSVPWKIESSFNHSNAMKLFETYRGILDGTKSVGVTYGTEMDHKKFNIAMNLSIFWLLVLIRSLSYIFPGQISSSWLQIKNKSAQLMRDQLTESKALSKEVLSLEQAIMKLENDKRDRNNNVET